MPISLAPPTAGWQQLSQNLADEGSRHQDRSLMLQQLAHNYERERRADRMKALDDWKQYRAMHKAEGGGGEGGLWGAGAGLAIGVILAPFTFGASLAVAGATTAGAVATTAAMVGAVTGLGATVGSAIDRKDASGAAAALSNFQQALPQQNLDARRKDLRGVQEAWQRHYKQHPEQKPQTAGGGQKGGDTGGQTQGGQGTTGGGPKAAGVTAAKTRSATSAQTAAPTVMDPDELAALTDIIPNPWYGRAAGQEKGTA